MKVYVHNWERVWNKTHTKYEDVFEDAGIWYLNLEYNDKNEPKYNKAELRINPNPKILLQTRVYIRKLSKINIDDECISFEGWYKWIKRKPATFCRFKCFYCKNEEKVS